MKFKYQKIPRSSDPNVPYLGMPLVPIRLYRQQETTLPIYALLDSGADNVILPSGFANALGIEDITVGKLQPTLGVGGGTADVYYFDDVEVELIGDNRKLKMPIGFAHSKDGRMVPPLLGRTFFAHYKSVSFEQTKETVELKV